MIQNPRRHLGVHPALSVMSVYIPSLLSSVDVNLCSGAPIIQLVAYECGELNPLNANYLGMPLSIKIPVDHWSLLAYSQYQVFSDTFVQGLNCVSCQHSIKTWLVGDFFEGEGGTHARNDGLFSTIFHFARLTSVCRDNHQCSTIRQKRSDVTLLKKGIPLINVEEKITSRAKANDDLFKKFQWIPHFNLLPFIFDVAITQTELAVWELRQDNHHKLVFSRAINNVEGRIACVSMAAKMSRILTYFTNQNMFMESMVPFNVWNDRHNGKRIRLGLLYVEFHYSDGDLYERMKNFYPLVCDVPGIEKFPVVENVSNYNDDSQIIRLTPVGVAFRVSDLTDVDIRVAIIAVSRTVIALHDRGILHCDIRWPNIIRNGQNWTLIDCTEFCFIKRNEKNLRVDRDARKGSHRLYMLNKMICMYLNIFTGQK